MKTDCSILTIFALAHFASMEQHTVTAFIDRCHLGIHFRHQVSIVCVGIDVDA